MSIEVFFLIVLIILNAFFAASEIALISLNDNKVRMLAESGDKKAILLQKLLSEPSRFLATIQVGITLAGFLASAFAAGSFSGQLASLLSSLGVPLSDKWLESISVVLITLVLSYFTLVVGELVPKRIAMQKAEPISMFVARPLTILSKITSPFVKLLTLSTNGLVRLFGVDPHANDEQVTEEEIRMMVDVGEERGAIQDTEKMMINNIFEFDNTIVSNIMIHRTNIIGIPADASLKEVLRFINIEKYTRFPVYEDNFDNIIGILHVKDILQYMESGDAETFLLKKIIRKPYFVPESMVTDDLFSDLQKNKVHLAVVIDEFGGTAGIVTLEDLLEEIVGNIFDEHDEEEFEYVKVDDDTFLFNGIVSLHEVDRIIDIKLPSEDYDTLSGFIIGQLGYIPRVSSGDVTVEFNGYLFTVEEVNEKRINKIRIVKNELEPDNEAGH
ncbi:putative hemolysin [Metabacillus crassostreae]|uniref:hemolysin family protein n=1 Tax=Metabacillus crassostreae TaxID=929098 RepID=UPI001959BE17|nr:hemolysin family protein [Metabacillus crassostreae]MBM7602929.1 putative hemolysin [Metabacillus crassostreae]